MADDIRIGVDVDTAQLVTGLNQAVDFISDAFGEIEQLIQSGIDAFERMEERAAAVGETLESMSGVSQSTADIYRDLGRETSALNKAFDEMTTRRLSPLVDQWRQVKLAALEYDQALKEISSTSSNLDLPVLGDLRRYGALGRFAGRSLGLISGTSGVVANDLTDRQLQLQRDAERRQAEAREQAFSELRASQSQRERNIRSRSLDRRFAVTDRLEQGALFRGQRRDLFSQFQDIDRQTLTRLQGLQSAAGTDISELRRQQAKERQRLAIQQEAANRKKDLADQLAANQAIIRAEKHLMQIAKHTADLLRKEHERQRQENAKLQRQFEVLEDAE